MLNYLWSGMILIGILVAIFNGRMPEITEVALSSSKEAIALCITMLGIVSMWSGLMKIAEKSGMIDSLSKTMAPFINFLFPDLPKECMAKKYISTNIIANVLGLGWASTPAGLKAMEEMQKLNKNKEVASKSMCMFLIFNMSSLQIVTINILAFRAEYGSANPAEIIGPGILATIISSIIGIVFAKIMERVD